MHTLCGDSIATAGGSLMHRTGRFGLGAASAVALAVTAGCTTGGASGSGSDAGTLTLQTNWTTAGQESVPLKTALKGFTEKTGIKVKILESGDDLNQVYE